MASGGEQAAYLSRGLCAVVSGLQRAAVCPGCRRPGRPPPLPAWPLLVSEFPRTVSSPRGQSPRFWSSAWMAVLGSQGGRHQGHCGSPAWSCGRPSQKHSLCREAQLGSRLEKWLPGCGSRVGSGPQHRAGAAGCCCDSTGLSQAPAGSESLVRSKPQVLNYLFSAAAQGGAWTAVLDREASRFQGPAAWELFLPTHGQHLTLAGGLALGAVDPPPSGPAQLLQPPASRWEHDCLWDVQGAEQDEAARTLGRSSQPGRRQTAAAREL